MLREIRSKLIIIIISFLLLILGTFFTSYFSINDHSAKELGLEIIQYHRFIIQRLTWQSLIDPENPAIETLQSEFEDALEIVETDGFLKLLEGTHFILAPADSEILKRQYQSISHLWPDYKSQLEIVLSLSQDSPEQREQWLILASLEREIVNAIDQVFASYEVFIRLQHERIEFIQFSFLILALPLVLISILIIRDRIVKPLDALNQSANQIKEGNLDYPVVPKWKDEIGQLASSMESMRAEIFSHTKHLEEKIIERTHELAVVTRFTQDISRKLVAEEIIESAVQQTKELLRADEVFLCLVSGEEDQLQMAANPAGLIFSENKVQPLANEIAFSNDQNTHVVSVNESKCLFLDSDPNKLCMSTPLRIGDKVIGSMCVQRDRKQPFNESEETAFSLLSTSAAIAIYNSQLVEYSKEQAKESARLMEREVLAGELHDELAQNLGVSKLQVGQVISSLDEHANMVHGESLKKIYNNLDDANQQIRMVISGLSSKSKNTHQAFEEDLRAKITEFQELSDLTVEFKIEGQLEKEIDPIIQRQLLLILQETLVNIRKHAKANSVQVEVFKDQEHVVLEVQDNGRGFDLEQADEGHSFGLKIMHTRAERSGGKLVIHSTPGKGTVLCASFPLAKDSNRGFRIGEGIVK